MILNLFLCSLLVGSSIGFTRFLPGGQRRRTGPTVPMEFPDYFVINRIYDKLDSIFMHIFKIKPENSLDVKKDFVMEFRRHLEGQPMKNVENFIDENFGEHIKRIEALPEETEEEKRMKEEIVNELGEMEKKVAEIMFAPDVVITERMQEDAQDWFPRWSKDYVRRTLKSLTLKEAQEAKKRYEEIYGKILANNKSKRNFKLGSSFDEILSSLNIHETYARPYSGYELKYRHKLAEDILGALNLDHIEKKSFFRRIATITTEDLEMIEKTLTGAQD